MFGKWIMGIVGISALGILVDILVKKGESEKYIKGVFGLFTLFVVVSPIPSLINKNLEFDSVFDFSGVTYNYDQNFTDYVFEKRYDEIEKAISAIIFEKYEVNSESKIYFVESCPEKIDVVYVNLKNVGILDEEQNKHIIEETRRLVSDKLKLNENQVVVGWQRESS